MPPPPNTLYISALAAIFAYLGWVQMTATSWQTVENMLRDRYEGEKYTGEGYSYKVNEFRVAERNGILYLARKHLIPFNQPKGQTHVYITFVSNSFKPDADALKDDAERIGLVESFYNENDVLYLTFDAVGVAAINKRLVKFGEILTDLYKTEQVSYL